MNEEEYQQMLDEYKEHGLVPCGYCYTGRVIYGENDVQDCPKCKGDGWVIDDES